MSYPKRTARALATAVAGSVVLIAAPAAYASVVDVNYDCKTPIGAKSAVSPIDIKAVQSGSSYKVTMSFQKGVSSSPVALGAGAMNPSAVITLGGADKGTVAVTGAANSAEIPANSPIKISDLSGTYVPKANGKVTLTAGVLTIKALGTTTTCTPGNSPGPSLELDVTGASGTGGTGGTGGSGGATAPAALPKTGPLDSAVALGTLGGTVVLVGAGGVLWLTRRNQRA
ncbi:peptidase [Streptomyces sp. NPDC048416]|uniref:peptidase n=1 Tax=Streptomyces sp. NPDC048416 TaxID=3365546 RepID=UPI00370FE407